MASPNQVVADPMDAIFTKYQNERGKYPYPDEDQDPKNKQLQQYYLMYGQAMISDWANNLCELPFAFDNTKRTFKERHEYARGTYSNEKLKDNIIGKTPNVKKNGRHITKMNISWDTFPIMAKMYDVMRESNMRQEYDVDAYCIDDDSMSAKAADRDMLKYLVSENAKELMRKTGYRPNTPIDPQKLGIETDEDVDLYFDCGAYSFVRELASISACNKSKLIGKFKVVQDHIFDDLYCHGIAVWKNTIDPVTKVPYPRWVPVYNAELNRCPLVIPYFNTNDGEGLSRFGEVRVMTIQQFRKENPHLNAEELIHVARQFQSLNPQFATYLMEGYNFYNQATGSYNLENLSRVKILVFEYQWLGTDVENYIKNEGQKVFRPVDFGFKISSDLQRKGNKQIQKRVVYKHSAQWVIGTDILTKYGRSNDVVYYGPDGDRTPGLDYFVTKTGNSPLIERGISIQDDIDQARIKLRNAIATAIPAPRMVIQQGLLDNVFLNNIKLQPQDNMKTFRELGYLFVNAVDDDGKPIFTNQKLVDFLQTGITEDINIFSGQILSGINDLRELFGLAQGADASTPQKYDSAKKTELAQENSKAALYATANCFQYLFENGMNDLVKKWQIVAKDSDFKLPYGPLGSKNMQILSLNDEFINSDYNIAMRLGQTEDQLNQLMQEVNQLRALGIQTGFQQGLTTAEYLYLNEEIRSGNPKQAMWVMAKIEKKKQAAQAMVDQQNQDNNAVLQQNSAAQAELNKQDTEKIKGTENRLTMVLKGLIEQQTQAVSGLMKDFAKEGGPSAKPAYEEIMHRTTGQIAGIVAKDMLTQQPQGPAQQGGPGGQDQGQPQGDEPEPMQQVA